MRFERTEIFNFKGAFRGLRNPLESWEKSDSIFGISNVEKLTPIQDIIVDRYLKKEGITLESYGDHYQLEFNKRLNWLIMNGYLNWGDNDNYEEDCCDYAFIGPNDMDLAQRMIKAGTSDSKFLRQIFVSVDITAPLYWLKEFDTYKINTTANSTSTMHKIASTPITINCFETNDMENIVIEDSSDPTFVITSNYAFHTFINLLEELRQKYNETKDQRYWKELIRLLPESWLQTRTITMNYAVIRNIYFQRRHHRLSEWKTFCNWVETLPYSAELITYEP